MRKVLYAAILALLFAVPLERVDVAKLLPIRAVVIYVQDETVVLETDTQHTGRGEDAIAALKDLKQNTSSVVYLDTAEYLLIAPGAEEYAESLRSELKPSVKVCVCDAAGKVSEAAKYLDVHGKLTELRHWRTK